MVVTEQAWTIWKAKAACHYVLILKLQLYTWSIRVLVHPNEVATMMLKMDEF